MENEELDKTEDPREKIIDNIDKDKDEKSQMIASFAFIFVICVLGLPMWWKTTEVYRVPLPYSKINELTQSSISIKSRIGIFTYAPERSALIIQELNNTFANNNILQLKFYQIKIEQNETQTKIQTPAQLEAKIIPEINIGPGDFVFMEWKNLEEEILITSGRTGFFSAETSSVKIQKVLKLWLLQEYKLKKILSRVSSDYEKKSSDIKSRIKQRSISVIVPQPHYDVVISVLNPRPDIHNIQWNVRGASEAYIQPFLEAINFVSKFILKSQWKYQIPLEFLSQKIKDNSTLGRHYTLPVDYLPHIVTAVEKKLGNPISDNPCIHLVVYIPPCENSPLYLYNNRRQRLSTTNIESFISYGWGGILIQNPSIDVCSNYLNGASTNQRVNIDLKSADVMQGLLHILRKLIDLEVDVPIDGVNTIPLDHVRPRQWEIDTYARNTAIHFITSATLTLQSLIQLLGGISNIVINDEVGNAVNDAYENVVLAKEYLDKNDIFSAVDFAKQAFIASETAFFHPSILALLYFPDDQKYAIYIPLFLPIMIPVFLSLKNIHKWKKNKNISESKKID